MINVNTDILILDGGFGSELLRLGLPVGTFPCVWNIERPDNVLKVHVWYLEAGARVITANTFSANPRILGDAKLAARCCAEGMRIANEARAAYKNSGAISAFELGPSGKMMQPYGELLIADAIDGYAECAAAVLADARLLPDVIMLETFCDLTEAKCAILGAKKAYAAAKRKLPPIYASCSYQPNGRLLSGETPELAAAALCSLGVSAVGANCGTGPDGMLPIVQKLVRASSVPVFANPNAGMPKIADGKAVYTLSAEDFALGMKKIVAAGARMVGGCCGTNPLHIKALANEVASMQAAPFTPNSGTCVSGSGKLHKFNEKPMIIAAAILPLPQEEIARLADSGAWDAFIDAAAELEERGAHAINVCLKGAADEACAFAELVPQLQQAVRVPLSIDTDDGGALESALLHYRGRAVINACDCTEGTLGKIIPLYKTYGGLLVIKTKDPEVPKTPDLKLKLARETLVRLKKMGVPALDVVFDPVVMPVRTHMSSLYSAQNSARLIREKTKCRVALGVSNYSLGKTKRALRETFFISSVITIPPDILYVNMRSATVCAMLKDEGML
jgi:5-methyltetrahydrofolate--homocysteine methyltransferase